MKLNNNYDHNNNKWQKDLKYIKNIVKLCLQNYVKGQNNSTRCNSVFLNGSKNRNALSQSEPFGMIPHSFKLCINALLIMLWSQSSVSIHLFQFDFT